MSQLIRNIRCLVGNHGRLLCHGKLYKSIASIPSHPNLNLVQAHPRTLINSEQKRFKKKRASKQDEEEDEGESDDEDESEENPLLMDDLTQQASDGSERTTISISSLRLDTFCKTAFAMTRAKVEESFYKGDIFVNGELPNKKSADISVNDEIDVVRSIDPENNRLAIVKRAIILRMPDKASEHGRMKLDIQRWQNISIERNIK